ncbi:hypothetical protein EJ03DRAFT_15170 [Teratosphaeria nubilosa]|uniref:Uncharacterized protein n=1 Tax=Teratosphaeria nubilosa TaxID=161662 RepID=A0A6G1KW42_9PEZI|nr:hypothetical protein EJ03DRAFT_15170 [Teratosphaeria nubilosa]
MRKQSVAEPSEKLNPDELRSHVPLTAQGPQEQSRQQHLPPQPAAQTQSHFEAQASDPQAQGEARLQATQAPALASAAVPKQIPARTNTQAQGLDRASAAAPQKPRPTQVKDVAFDHLVSEVDFIVSAKYSSSRGSKEFENAFDATSDIEDSISKILAAAGVPASARTQKNASEALCKIADTITEEHSSTLESEVRKHFDGDRSIAEAMIKIICSRDTTAKNILVTAESGRDTLSNRLENLAKKYYALEMGFDEVLDEWKLIAED